jgi:hypothetical protein
MLTLAYEAGFGIGSKVFPILVGLGDGRTNYEEYLAGTDPQNPNSRLTIASFAPLPGGCLTLTWDTVSGKTYTVQRSSTLTPNQWTTLQTNIAGDGSTKSFTDTNPGSATRLFYRIAVTPKTENRIVIRSQSSSETAHSNCMEPPDTGPSV